MKNCFIICFFSLVILSCKKDRTCTCTVSKTGTSTTTGKADLTLFPGFATPLADTSFITNVTDIQVVDITSENVNKRTAKSNCISYTEPYNETTLTSVPASSFHLSVVISEKGERHYSCKLK